MKDFTEHELRSARPNIDLKERLRYALEQLFDDKKHKISDRVSPFFTYEELIGILLLVEDKLKENEDTEWDV